eukprot:2524210-Pleurochrysis_carterae.AAC.3
MASTSGASTREQSSGGLRGQLEETGKSGSVLGSELAVCLVRSGSVFGPSWQCVWCGVAVCLVHKVHLVECLLPGV